MVFSSFTFIFVFLPIALITYLFCNDKLKNIVLLIASLFFYSWGEPKFISIMILSILINYLLGRLLDKYNDTRNIKKGIVILAVILNLAILIFFKYSYFIVDNLNLIMRYLPMGIISFNGPTQLPIGISFYTFQALSYIIDVYRKETKVQKNIINLALYISLFPQLIAGPIVRYHDIDQQINNRKITVDKFYYGIQRFIIGLGKKIIFANTVGYIADNIFAVEMGNLNGIIAWIGIIAYMLQIYFDFSGYSDMAIGLGAMFGFNILENFNYPYISKSIQEFWRRWHISLSSWFRDYLYIPLGGNRKGIKATYRNLVVVFFATGLWHGASWNFIVWGLWHGIFIIIEKTSFGNILNRLSTPIKHVYTLIIVLIGWILFRSENLVHALGYIRSMLFYCNISNLDLANYLDLENIFIIILAVIGTTPIPKQVINNLKKNSKIFDVLEPIALIGIFLLSVMYLSGVTYNPFIYFRF